MLLCPNRCLKVPLRVSTAFSSAAQRSWQSTHAAVAALEVLLRSAMAAGLIQSGSVATSGSLGASVQQQLQQAGVLSTLAAVMTSMSAALQDEAAALVSQDAAALGAADMPYGCTQAFVRPACSMI